MLLRALDHLEEVIISVLIGVATLIIFAAVLHRYGMSTSISFALWGKAHGMDWAFSSGRAVFGFLKNFSFTWAQVLCIYLFVWMAKFGAAYGARTGIHVGVDVAVNRLTPASRQAVVLFALCAGIVFTLIVGTLGARFVWHIAATEQVSADLEMPMWIVYLAVPLGSYLMSFRFMQVAVHFIRTGHLPHHDHGHVDGLDDETPILPGTLTQGDAR